MKFSISKWCLGIVVVLCTQLALAADPRIPDEATPGALVIGRVAPGSKVTLGKRNLRVSPDGYFLLGVNRDAKGVVAVRIVAPGGQSRNHEIKVRARKYRIQRIDGLPPRKVTPKKMDWARIKRENALIGKARRRDDARSDFLGKWQWPVRGRISGVYGSQRILNGKPKRPHFGVDVAAPRGTPVVAPRDALVSLVHQGMFFSGKTLILDHGHGLSSVYIHLDSIKVKQGQRVRAGEVIGTVGMTGRATGPHLHWGLNLFAQRLDPALLVGPMPKS